MKHVKLVAIGLVLTAVLVVGAFTVLAQGDQPTIPPEVPDYGPGMMGRQHGGMMGGQHGGMMGGQHGGMMGNFSLPGVAAQMLDMTVDEIQAELSAGISIADLAANHDVDAQTIIDEALAQHQAALDTAVANGTLTQEQADWMQANMATMIATRINEPWGTMSGGRGSGHGSGGCHGGQTPPQGTGA
ncbi:MAG: hypothetical protein IAE79_10060 [Anaerolinea sp.]|nr:hypothetical protein [Anaerolinea sp.]